MTTRRRDAALSGDQRSVVNVGCFTRAEAAAYLEAKLADHATSMEGADELADSLGFLPLALAQAAAYLVDRNLNCADYLRRLNDRRRKLGDLAPTSVVFLMITARPWPLRGRCRSRPPINFGRSV